MTMTPEMSQLKTRLKTTWESGDYGVFAKYLEKGALQFFDRLNLAPGTRLLDVGCGAGQLTIPAARRGIKVTALDLAANLAEQARDARGPLGRAVRDELEGRHEAEVRARAELVAEVRLRVLERLHRLGRLVVVAEHAHVHARDPQVRRDDDLRHRRERDPRVTELLADERAQLTLQERVHAVRSLICHGGPPSAASPRPRSTR